MIHRTVCSKVHHIDGASGISANPLTILAALFAMALLGAALTSPAIADDDPPAAEAAAADHDKDAGHKDGDHEAGDHDEEGDGADGHGWFPSRSSARR